MNPVLSMCPDERCLTCPCHAHAEMSGPEYDEPVFPERGISTGTLVRIGLLLIVAGVLVYLVVTGGRL